MINGGKSVDRRDLAPPAALRLTIGQTVREQVREGEAGGIHDITSAAARKAVDQQRAIASFSQRKRWSPVIVRRTSRKPATGAGFSHPVEP